MTLPVPTVEDPGFVTAGAFPVIVLSILLIPMFTITAIVTLGLYDLASYGVWSRRIHERLAERSARIAAKRALSQVDAPNAVESMARRIFDLDSTRVCSCLTM